MSNKIQELHFLRIENKINANKTQGLDGGVPSKVCVSGMLVTETGVGGPQPLT